jgi:hypothetical protein
VKKPPESGGRVPADVKIAVIVPVVTVPYETFGRGRMSVPAFMVDAFRDMRATLLLRQAHR